MRTPRTPIVARSAIALALAGGAVLSLARCAESRRTLPPPAAASPHDVATDAAVSEAKHVEEAIIAAARRVRPATVCLVFEDTENNRRGTGSGVIVADDGSRALVLTCGHITREPGRACTVVLPDGRRFEGVAEAARESGGIDLGLVAFDTGAEALPVARLATELPAPGDWVAVLGHPRGLWIDHGRDVDDAAAGADAAADDACALGAVPQWRNDAAPSRRGRGGSETARSVRPPVIRAGRIWSEPGEGTGMRFDAPLEAGDSGGPVIDGEGRVVAIASRCGWKSFWNWGSSVALLRGDPASLLDDATELPPGDAEPGAGAGNPNVPRLSRDARPWLDAFRPVAEQAGRAVALVEDADGPRAYALAVAPGGLFVTKGSEAGFDAPLTIARGGRRSTAVRLAYDPDADLLLLRASALDTIPAARRPGGAPPPGSFLINVGESGEVLSLGAMALEPSFHDEPGGGPFLGVGWQVEPDGAARITSVMPGTPAARAGLRIDDRIIAVDGRTLDARRSLGEEITGRRAGDPLRLEVERAGDAAPWTIVVALDRRQPSLRLRDRGNTRSATSRVLPHRTRIWHQDGVVDPDQCGSAVIDLDGRLVGFNAGRFDRTTTLVIPAAELDRRVAALLRRARDDPQSFDDLAAASFAATESNARLRLHAADARYTGPRRLARLIGNALTPDGGGITIMADDRLRWDVVIDEPGRFEIIFAGALHAPRDVRLGVGDAVVEATIPQGRLRRGVSIGEVDVRHRGRIPVTFEWLRTDDDVVPGSMRHLELRRVDAVGTAGDGAV